MKYRIDRTMRTLVTGGAGFIGSHVADALVRYARESGRESRHAPVRAHEFDRRLRPRTNAEKNEIFTVGVDSAVTVRELADAVSRQFDIPCRIESLPVRHEVLHAFASHDKVRAVFAMPPFWARLMTP